MAICHSMPEVCQVALDAAAAWLLTLRCSSTHTARALIRCCGVTCDLYNRMPKVSCFCRLVAVIASSCNISDFARENLMFSAAAHLMRMLILSWSPAVTRSWDVAPWVISSSSMYEISCLLRGCSPGGLSAAVNMMKRTGQSGDPWERAALNGAGGSHCPSKLRHMLQPVPKLAIVLIRSWWMRQWVKISDNLS